MNLVNAEARAPEEFPKAHCKPVHLPDAAGPATVWVIGQVLAIVKPHDAPVSNNMAIASLGRATTLNRRNPALPKSPTVIKVICTLVREAPRAIHRSPR